MILLPMVASAFTGLKVIDGIKYEISTMTQKAEVIANNSVYSGDIVIPSTIECDGVVCNVTSIGESAFDRCSGLTSVIIPNSVTKIKKFAFLMCSALTSITIPNSVTSLGEKAFFACTSLTSVTIPNSVAFIENGVFSDCTSLTSVTIENTDTGADTFSGCSGLISVTFGSSVTNIGTGVFQKCTSLTSITIPNSVTSIGGYAFSKCSGLTSITIPNSVTSLGEGAFSWCYGLTSITIPNSVTIIGSAAFQHCTGLTSINIPNSVTKIGGYAFYGCTGLTTISIGSGIKNIDNVAFSYCQKLTDVYCYAGGVPNTKSDIFNDSSLKSATLHVPETSISLYKQKTPWNAFKSIIAIGEDIPENQKCATPTISYTNGTLTFNCDTEGAGCQYTISDNDIKSGVGYKVQLTATYNISVYATKAGYENSETATATLCWIDQKPATEGITDGIANVPAKALLIKNNGGQLTVEGAADGEAISVYTVNAVQSGSAISQNGAASIDTNLKAGSIAIVKIGDKSVKVVIK